jgi:putative ubiquitin-RnfH superfamily antitoxin RatB of RatAB toxin-antitoxin module
VNIEVVYAEPNHQRSVKLDVVPGSTAREVAISSMLTVWFPDIDLQSVAIGVFGEVVEDDYVLQNGDRLELYRPLLLDPMQARRARAGKN